MNLPNKLTLIRIFLVPIVLLVYLFPYSAFGLYLPVFELNGVDLPLKNLIVLGIFLIASLTDFLDGNIARKRNLVTTFGKFIDPIADKMIIDTVFLLLVYDRVIPVLPVIIMIIRDVIVDGCRMIANGKGVVIPANFLGKFKTVLQIITISLLLLNNIPFEFFKMNIADILLWFTMFISVLGGYNYFNSVKYLIFESM